MLPGGKLGQFLYKKDKRLQALLMALSTWGGCLPLYMVFNEGGSDGRSLWVLHLLSFLGGLMIAMTGQSWFPQASGNGERGNPGKSVMVCCGNIYGDYVNIVKYCYYGNII